MKDSNRNIISASQTINSKGTVGPGPALTKDTKFYIPLTYSLGQMGWYRKESDPVFIGAEHLQAVPDELHLQHTYRLGIKSNQVLTSRHGMFTGLRRTDFQFWLYGDMVANDQGDLNKSLIILEFFAPEQFRLYYFPNQYPKIKHRQATIREVITAILHNRIKNHATIAETRQIQEQTNHQYQTTNHQ